MSTLLTLLAWIVLVALIGGGMAWIGWSALVAWLEEFDDPDDGPPES